MLSEGDLVLQGRNLCANYKLSLSWRGTKKICKAVTCHHLSVIMHCQACQATMLVLSKMHPEQKRKHFLNYYYYYYFNFRR